MVEESLVSREIEVPRAPARAYLILRYRYRGRSFTTPSDSHVAVYLGLMW